MNEQPLPARITQRIQLELGRERLARITAEERLADALRELQAALAELAELRQVDVDP